VGLGAQPGSDRTSVGQTFDTFPGNHADADADLRTTLCFRTPSGVHTVINEANP